MDRDEIITKMDALVASTNGETFSAEQATAYEALETDLARVNKDAELRARHNAYKSPNTTGVSPVVAKFTAKGDEALEQAFDHYLRTGIGNADLAQFAQSEGTSSQGGYTVPPGFQAKLIDVQKAYGGIANAASHMDTGNGQTVTYPSNDDTGNVGEIVAENGTFAAGADLVFGQVSLPTFKYSSGGASSLPLKVSVELLQDSAFDVSGLVSEKLGIRIARLQATHYATGVGTTQPLGLFTTTKDVINATVSYSALLDVVHTVDPVYRNGAQFIMNDATLKSIRKLTDDNNRPIWQAAQDAGIGSMPGGALLGYEVVIDQASTTVASGVNYIAFGDISAAYIVRTVGSPVIVVNPWNSAAHGQIEFSAWTRSGGTIQQRGAYATLAG